MAGLGPSTYPSTIGGWLQPGRAGREERQGQDQQRPKGSRGQDPRKRGHSPQGRRRGRRDRPERQQAPGGTAPPRPPGATTERSEADDRKRPQRRGTRRAAKADQTGKEGAGNATEEQGQRGRGAGPPRPKPATRRGRRRPTDEAPQPICSMQPQGEERGCWPFPFLEK